MISQDGKQLGIFSPKEALEKASEAGLDLVEIAPRANPPVAKIIDFTKFKYEQEKKEREAARKQKRGAELKEVWLTPFMGDKDYETRVDRVKEFLTDGHKVRVVIKFKGPQMQRRDQGYKLAGRTVEDAESISDVDQEPRFFGRQLVFTLTPVKSKVKGETKNGNEENQA